MQTTKTSTPADPFALMVDGEVTAAGTVEDGPQTTAAAARETRIREQLAAGAYTLPRSYMSDEQHQVWEGSYGDDYDYGDADR